MRSGTARSEWQFLRFDRLIRILLPVATEEQLTNLLRLIDAEVEMLRLRDSLETAEIVTSARTKIEILFDDLGFISNTESLSRMRAVEIQLKFEPTGQSQAILRTRASLLTLIDTLEGMP